MSDDDAYIGHQGITSAGSSHNTELLHQEEESNARRVMIPVKIVKLNGGGVGPAPTADVVPVIHQVDGLGKKTEHGTIYGVAVGRIQSSNGTIINDPVEGDFMAMIVADRDISTFLKNSAPALPGSSRKSSLSDGVLHHAVGMSETPKQYIHFKSDGLLFNDVNGNIIETFPDRIEVVPKDTALIYLGGKKTSGTFGFVQTDAGTSSKVKAKL